MARMIDADELYKFLTDQLVKETGMFSKGVNKGINIARSAVKNPDAIPAFTPSNNPLTLEQLQEMEKQVVFVDVVKKEFSRICELKSQYGIVRPEEDCVHLFNGRSIYFVSYGAWLAYPYPLPHIDREDWEPCEFCNGKESLYQYTNSTKLFINTFGKARTLVTECRSCPPYADCSMKNVPARSAFIINFCPHCGRPLMPEAWAELERRLKK